MSGVCRLVALTTRVQVQKRVALLVQNQSINLGHRSLATVSKPKSATVYGSNSLVPPSILRSWYNTFVKSTAMYSTFLMGVIIVGEMISGYGTEFLWHKYNHGRTFSTVDWTKFDKFDEDED